MWQELTQSVVSSATLDDVRVIVCSLHDLLPRLVDVGEPLCLLRKLLRNISATEHSFQIDPKVLDDEPVLDDFRGRRELRDPFLNLRLERSVVPVDEKLNAVRTG